MNRHSTRFEPDPFDTALVEFSQTARFEPEKVALIIDESFTGCGLVMTHAPEGIKVDQKIMVKVGKMNPLLARIVWVKKVDNDITRLGIEFI